MEIASTILCRRCPLVSLYHLVSTHPERVTLHRMAKLEKIRLRTAQCRRLKNKISQAQRSTHLKARWGRKRRPVAKLKSPPTLIVREGIGSCFRGVEFVSESDTKIIKLCFFVKSRPCNKKERLSIVNLGHAVELERPPVLTRELPLQVVGNLPKTYNFRRLNLTESLQLHGKVFVGKGDLNQVKRILLSTLERLKIIHEPVKSTKRCAYVAQYCPSLSQNHPSILDLLSCTFSLELVELSPFYLNFRFDKLPILTPPFRLESNLQAHCKTLKRHKHRPLPIFCILISFIGGAAEKLPTMMYLINLELYAFSKGK
ncbi:hypothetical protein L0F63_003329 [Massospora cicadina]|nr:hypothetical protein L0F63_003329 [Massospora cicadina]